MKNLAVSEVLSDSHCNSNVNNCGNESYAANIFFMTTVSRLPSHFEEITFFLHVPRSYWYSFDSSQKDERLSWPWSHTMALNPEALDWKTNTLTIRSLLLFMVNLLWSGCSRCGGTTQQTECVWIASLEQDKKVTCFFLDLW